MCKPESGVQQPCLHSWHSSARDERTRRTSHGAEEPAQSVDSFRLSFSRHTPVGLGVSCRYRVSLFRAPGFRHPFACRRRPRETVSHFVARSLPLHGHGSLCSQHAATHGDALFIL